MVVTGGLGTLGLMVARWLASQGVAHVVLLGRAARPSQASPEEQHLLGGGCPAQVQVVQADMGSAADVAAALGGGGGCGLPVLAVMHAGGVLADATVANQSLAGGLQCCSLRQCCWLPCPLRMCAAFSCVPPSLAS